jgi:hypothetical protein
VIKKRKKNKKSCVNVQYSLPHPRLSRREYLFLNGNSLVYSYIIPLGARRKNEEHGEGGNFLFPHQGMSIAKFFKRLGSCLSLLEMNLSNTQRRKR